MLNNFLKGKILFKQSIDLASVFGFGIIEQVVVDFKNDLIIKDYVESSGHPNLTFVLGFVKKINKITFAN